LFTEDYMVDFLLDNTLGAWHAGKLLAGNPALAEIARNEDELREAVALPGCPWNYLRFTKGDDGRWAPAAGAFPGWPKTAKEVTCLDPCMGSGHFIVAIFERMVALRMAEEPLTELEGVEVVIASNLFGLEIDPRCAQIAAFNLALTAWRRVGFCALPSMNLACSGLAPNAKREDWLKLAGDDGRLQNGMDRLYTLFKDAPILGSLISPGAATGDLLVASFHELQPLLSEALAVESGQDRREMVVTASGLTKAAEILSTKFTLVITNVPFLGYREMSEELVAFVSKSYSAEKGDLGYCLWRRIEGLLVPGGTSALVSLQHWLSLRSYMEMRKRLLTELNIPMIAHLGTGAFETVSGQKVNVTLTIATKSVCAAESIISLCDAAGCRIPSEKATYLLGGRVYETSQEQQYINPDHRISFGGLSDLPRLSNYVDSLAGIMNGDTPKFIRFFWEIPAKTDLWAFLQSTVAEGKVIGGLESIILFDEVNGHLREDAKIRRVKLHNADERGNTVWGRHGVAISQMSSLPASRYFGAKYDSNVAAVVPKDESHLAAIWSFCSSPEFHKQVRAIDRKLNVTNATFGKIPFDLHYWQEVAAEKYPSGLPSPSSNDPTQWLFNGQPKNAEHPLHVAVARLLGYSWPRQNGSSFPDCPTITPDGLETLADVDGIVCLSATRGEPAAAERVRELLAQAFGEDWSASVLQELLAQVGFAGETLDVWLHEGFFEQHCSLFHHRPFIWHIWDGHHNGFSALVNYHRLNYATLESLTYAYLGDWIRRQRAAVDAGDAGSDSRLQAAKQLEGKLKLILEGEPPYDLFVRWKPLSQQAIGWHPDLNDGVRMNIRPFATADILRKRVKIKWDKDRGKEPVREQKDFPWFWGWDGKTQDFAGVGKEPDGNRWNDCHYTNEAKRKARNE
jgi:hypothetical protein